ncbi:AAA family ATPase [Bradyrhizobium sp. Tv2a-2]|uniref:AAA family ATPase n=1 Tax=Bradyrhizobium sp. Tv2a-2 TaxID=113395 RepID=UPI0004144FFA|nr:AAA family ATPase [Bradyrhizobium sp. Tv2a-2]
MHIKFVEIANFRKLLSTRVDLSETTTLFVGANNSGKSSAMLALRRLLVPQRCPFELHDLTLCHWPSIDAVGQSWISANEANEIISLDTTPWESLLPTLDLWLDVAPGEMHRVRDMIPTLDWEGGALGVRLRYEPDDLTALYKDFLAAVAEADSLRETASAQQAAVQSESNVDPAQPPKLTLWPSTLIDYLSRRLTRHFTLRAYTLDPSQLKSPVKSQAQLQPLTASSLPIDGDPLKGLIRVHDIPAQRGFGEETAKDDDDGASSGPAGSRLSDQLRSYYSKHLDPAKGPDAKDLGALQAIEAAQDAFDQRLTESFAEAFREVEGMGYPGVSDPRPKVSTRLKAIDGLNHAAAVTFMVDVTSVGGEVTPLLRLPENNNGLGYQNLISMIFRLMSFRDAWMRVGKASKTIVSTHSSHVAHEIPFANLRYFRRLPAGMAARIPVSMVINLQEVFGTKNETQRFVTRYLRAHHADLFFADAAILVEGPAERMLLPNLIRNNYERLNQSYVTLLEIGGSHAHRLKPLIDCLGLLTLIITDLDSVDATGSSAQPQRGADQTTNNDTLKTWVPKLPNVDALMDADEKAKISENSDDQLFAVRTAYQTPVQVKLLDASKAETAQPYTFEDALAFENIEFFAKLEGGGLVRKFREAILKGGDAGAVGKGMFDALRTGKKAEFALEVIDAKDFDTIRVPSYVAEGLAWLQSRLEKKQVDILPENGGAKA